MINTLNIYGLLKKRALITRKSAGVIREILKNADRNTETSIDFTGVEAVTPSFVDELLAGVEEFVSKNTSKRVRTVFLHPPTRLSTKFSAVARAHNLRVTEQEDGSWVITSGVGGNHAN